MSAAAAYAAVYLLLTVPGWPIGRAVFGRGPIGWITGAALGYGASALALWMPIAAGHATTAAFLLAWIAAVAAGLLAARRIRSPLEPQPWPPRDRLALAAILLLIALLMFPLARVGERDASGSRLYRAYFTADFIWHTALASELGKYAMPPRNPYFAREEMHYYWTYFLPPAVIAASGPALLRDVQLALKMNELMTALIFGGVFSCSPGPRRAAVPQRPPDSRLRSWPRAPRGPTRCTTSRTRPATLARQEPEYRCRWRHGAGGDCASTG